MPEMPKARSLLGWALLAAMLTVVAVIVMIIASVAFVVVAGVCIVGASVTLFLMLQNRKHKSE